MTQHTDAIPGPDSHDSTAPTTVTFVGAGAIGLPMACRLATAGFKVTAVDPSPHTRARAREAGLLTAADLQDVPLLGDIVVVMVATGDQVLDAVGAATARGPLTGQTWVIGSTVGPKVAEVAAGRLAAVGAQVVDAPVLGGVPGAEEGALRILAAGNPSALDRVRDLFQPLGQVAEVGDQPGQGQAVKVVNQLCSSVHLAAAAEALSLAARLGLDPARVVPVISGSSGSSWFLEDRGSRMAAPPAPDEVLTRLAILAKDNALVVHEADQVGAHTPLARAAAGQYRQAAEQGLLELDDSQIIRTYLPGR
ncbi:NAD(P)-dependent oxidoreductase [Actinacidiphila oryziradicis]|uniref:NAD(P)-dependent oxidoreductase n=1 Tax=Actinacidiphila oryziradicis TaxID=2571141 RepID=UPI00145CDDBC|nr:NAD(P)-dependent oxidoreductase [Actinacidiphila oryziradicis]